MRRSSVAALSRGSAPPAPPAKKSGRLGASSSRARAFLDKTEADATKTRSKRRRLFVKLVFFLLVVGAGAFLAAARGHLGPEAERLTRPHDPTAGMFPWLDKKAQDGNAALTSATDAAVESGR